MNYKVNEHVLGGRGSGNGHHGNCVHCGLALCTDLGYDSWSGTKCVDRDPKYLHDFPDDIASYANFNSLIFKPDKQIFIRPFRKERYTYNQLRKRIDKLKMVLIN